MGFADKESEELAERIAHMKKSGTHICCSIGFLTEHQARILRAAGLDRINHNLNTSRRFYPEICSTHTYERRIQNVQMLQRVGFEICCGGIIGMGETKEDVVDMLLDLVAINPESVPINFLLPVKGTRLAERDISGLTFEYCIKILCLARLLLPKSDIRCAAGREVYFKGHEKELFKVVDSIFASGYLTEGGQGLNETFKTIENAGFTWFVESADKQALSGAFGVTRSRAFIFTLRICFGHYSGTGESLFIVRGNEKWKRRGNKAVVRAFYRIHDYCSRFRFYRLLHQQYI
jgi:biotin synthase